MIELVKLPNIDSISGFSPYRQYNADSTINAYFNFLKKRLYKITQDRINLLNQISYSYDGNNTYIQFYYETLFGLQRTFGETKVNNQYDTGKGYDSGFIYDDTNFDGFLDLDYYKVLVKYFLDYSEESYTLGWLYGFVCEFCNLKPNQVTITEHVSHVVVNIPRTRESVLLQKIFIDKNTYLNVPIDEIRFNLT